MIFFPYSTLKKRKEQLMKKIIFLLSLLFATLVFASCGETTPAGTTQVPPMFTDPNAPALPSDIKLSGDFNILVVGNSGNDFAGDADSSTVVEYANYQRNEIMRERYGVNITSEEHFGFGITNGSGTGFQKIYTEYMAGSNSYDAAMIGTYDVASLARNGVLWDLSSLPHIDLTKSYWDQKANEDLAIGGKMFYTTGDISIQDNNATHAMIFNKDMIKDFNLEDPYTLVKNGEWTMEKFGSMVKSVGQDMDANGLRDEKDLYGLLTWNDPMLAVLSSACEKIVDFNDSGEVELALYNERSVNLYDTFCDIVYDQQHAYNFQYDANAGKEIPSSAWDTNRDTMFNEGRALFYFHLLSVVGRHRDSDVDFGILPYPKLDATQEEYGHLVGAFHAQFFCIPLTADPVRSSAVGELLAYYGQEILTPAYYEKTLCGKYVRDLESTEMLDIIFATHVFDLGSYYRFGDISTWIGRMYRTRQSLMHIYETYRGAAESQIAQLNDAFDAMSDNVVYSGNGEIAEKEEIVIDTTPYTNATVVYLDSKGKGNGSTAESAIGTMKGALDALDLSKDCTVVVSGKYVLGETFQYTDFFDGSVTVTSVYDGVDYRENGAEIMASGVNFVCSGEYVFRNLDFHFMDKYFRILASHYPITMDTGLNFKMENSGMNGLRFGESVCILGGHYQGTPVLAGGEKPVDPIGGGVIDITIKSGSHYCIGVFSHSLENSVYPGNNVINISGDADVPTLWILPENAAFEVGEVEVNVIDNANVNNIYGSSAFGHVDKVTINWLGGTINNFEKSRDKKNPDYEAANGTHLVYSEAVAGHPNLEILRERFDSVTQK